jgi:iron complex outermembrane receptor protein
MEAAWKPVNWFRWDVNATWAKAINKDWTITADKLDKDGNFITYIDPNDNKVKKVTETVNLGNTHTTFSPDFIFNNIFTFTYKGFNLSLQSQYIGEQYLTNSDFKSYVTTDDDNKEVNVGMMLEGYFNTNIDLSYNFGLKKLGIKDAKIGVSLYNIFNTKYDNNGWADPHYKVATDGSVTAYTEGDLYEAGFAPSAPFNFMAHLSLNF